MAPVREQEKAERGESSSTNSAVAGTASQCKIKALEELTLVLLREVQSLTEVQTLDLDEGLDFYDEVSRFEIQLIRRALIHTGGHQGRAARLLNLKMTTLNSKIKHYNIKLEGFPRPYPALDAAQLKAHLHA